MPEDAVQSALRCDACGGQCRYSPQRDVLECNSCGKFHSIERPTGDDPETEHSYDPGKPCEEKLVLSETRSHGCETCGGVIEFIGTSLSENCPYCDGPVVLKGQDKAFKPLALIPFRLDEAAARPLAINWMRKRLAAPKTLLTAVTRSRAIGIYAPFWTFDSTDTIDYVVTYRQKLGKLRFTRKIEDRTDFVFDDFLMPASHHVTPLIRDGMLHEFSPGDLRSFNPAYLAGFAAEQHHQSVADGLRANAEDKDLLIRNHIKQHAGKRRVETLTYNTDISGVRYRRILLPVWIFHYRFADKPYKIVVSGIDGRTFGERPFCLRRLAALSGILAAALIGFGWYWGAAPFL